MLSEFKRVKKESAGSRKDVQYTNMQQYKHYKSSFISVQYTNMQQYKQYLKQDMIQRSNKMSKKKYV